MPPRGTTRRRRSDADTADSTNVKIQEQLVNIRNAFGNETHCKNLYNYWKDEAAWKKLLYLRSKHNRLVREEETAAARLAREEEERSRRDVVSRAVESESSVPHQPAPEADDITPVPRFRRRVRRHESNVAMEEDSDDGMIYLRYCLFCYQKHSVYTKGKGIIDLHSCKRQN